MKRLFIKSLQYLSLLLGAPWEGRGEESGLTLAPYLGFNATYAFLPAGVCAGQ